MGYTMTWSGRELIGIYNTSTSAFVSVCSYDDAGLRTVKNVIGKGIQYYTWDNGKLTAQTSSSINLYFSYDSNDQLVAIYVGGTMYYYMRNAQNDIIGIVDRNGNVVAKYTYDSWGVPVSITDGSGNDGSGNASHVANINPFRYRGYYYDAESGLYYLKTRYYDPTTGRFINGDVFMSTGESVLGYNMYAYCKNNPVTMSDDSGCWPSWATKVLIGVAVIAVCAVVSVATAGAGAAPAVAAINCIATGALQGAVTGAAVGTITGGVGGAVSHRLSTGSWNGVENAILDGAATGFMTGAITGAITGGANSSQCFIAGTLVLTADGYVPIEEIESGDRVFAENPETGEKGIRTVVQTFVNETDELVHISVKDTEITTTPEHPFYVPQKGWTGAIHLRAGDMLVLSNGEYVIVEKIEHELLESPTLVYNFEVEDFHTYYVSEYGVLVHNVCAAAKKAQLPTEGKIRYVPPKSAGNSLPRTSMGGYIDRFGNTWIKGSSRTIGEAFEWDVQLSSRGKHMLGWLSRDGMHLNVSLKGLITH